MNAIKEMAEQYADEAMAAVENHANRRSKIEKQVEEMRKASE